jgi:hypothetical protein
VNVAIYLAGSFLILISAAIGVTSVAVHARVPWRTSEMGRHLMYYMTVVAAILSLSAISVVQKITEAIAANDLLRVAETAAAGSSTWFLFLRLGLYVCLPIVMGQRLKLQLRAQREQRALRGADPGRPPA